MDAHRSWRRCSTRHVCPQRTRPARPPCVQVWHLAPTLHQRGKLTGLLLVCERQICVHFQQTSLAALHAQKESLCCCCWLHRPALQPQLTLWVQVAGAGWAPAGLVRMPAGWHAGYHHVDITCRRQGAACARVCCCCCCCWTRCLQSATRSSMPACSGQDCAGQCCCTPAQLDSRLRVSLASRSA